MSNTRPVASHNRARRARPTRVGRTARLVLADGTVFEGRTMGASGVCTGEVVFTTGMTGYQEVLTDPSYCGQIVTMTAPQMGNTGVTPEDDEARAPALAGFAIHELAERPSNWRQQESLDSYLKQHEIVGIQGIDTRSLTRHVRDQGAQVAAIGVQSAKDLHDCALAAPPMQGRDLTGQVTCQGAYEWTSGHGLWALESCQDEQRQVVAVDFGVKHSILRCLVDVGCRVTVVPSTASASDILRLRPDGVFLSNGPGDPAAVVHGVQLVKELLGKRPVFGICLGHQLMCQALGGSTYKLKFGHRGLNQPVHDLATRRVEVTSQNHGFSVDIKSLEGRCEVTHIHLNDGTCEGMRHLETGAFSVQYHPEASAGPHDARYLFQRFRAHMDADA